MLSSLPTEETNLVPLELLKRYLDIGFILVPLFQNSVHLNIDGLVTDAEWESLPDSVQIEGHYKGDLSGKRPRKNLLAMNHLSDRFWTHERLEKEHTRFFGVCTLLGKSPKKDPIDGSDLYVNGLDPDSEDARNLLFNEILAKQDLAAKTFVAKTYKSWHAYWLSHKQNPPLTNKHCKPGSEAELKTNLSSMTLTLPITRHRKHRDFRYRWFSSANQLLISDTLYGDCISTMHSKGYLIKIPTFESNGKEGNRQQLMRRLESVKVPLEESEGVKIVMGQNKFNAGNVIYDTIRTKGASFIMIADARNHEYIDILKGKKAQTLPNKGSSISIRKDSSALKNITLGTSNHTKDSATNISSNNQKYSSTRDFSTKELRGPLFIRSDNIGPKTKDCLNTNPKNVENAGEAGEPVLRLFGVFKQNTYNNEIDITGMHGLKRDQPKYFNCVTNRVIQSVLELFRDCRNASEDILENKRASVITLVKEIFDILQSKIENGSDNIEFITNELKYSFVANKNLNEYDREGYQMTVYREKLEEFYTKYPDSDLDPDMYLTSGKVYEYYKIMPVEYRDEEGKIRKQKFSIYPTKYMLNAKQYKKELFTNISLILHAIGIGKGQLEDLNNLVNSA